MNSFKNKQQGSALTNLVGGIAILGVSVFLLAKLANSGYTADVADTTENATATRIMPAGSLKLGDGAEPGQRTGKQVFDKICIQCHAADSATAFSPKITKNDEWAPRIAKGLDTLVKNAVNGFTGQGNMPAKGGAMDLTDEEVARAVVYMTNESGGSFAEPAAGGASSNTAASESATPEAAAKTEDKKTEEVAAAPANDAKAQENFDKSCKACHAANSVIPHAPRLTNKEDWAPRIAQGKDTLFKHAIEGYTGPNGGVMPPKGGSSLSDDEVKAVVVYMANQAGGKF